jgi:RecA-family ATPase
MKTASEILREFGLPPPPSGRDRYYTTCPKCSHTRSIAHRKSACLGVSLTDDGVTFGCNHCGWKGGKKFANGKDSDPVIGTYEYIDESGKVLFRKIKTASKKFWIEHPNGHGGWIKGMGNARKILYRLSEALEGIGNGHPILIVEGEKDCDNLNKIGVLATCNFDGASEPDKKPKWRSEYSEVLRDADVVIVPDHDPAGYAHADAIASMSIGVAKTVRLLRLAEHWPQCPKGGDVSDWLQAGNGREGLDALIAHAKPWMRSDANQAETTGDPPLAFLNIAAWHGRPVPEREWTVKDRIPRNNVTLLSGEGSIGKSILSLQLSSAVVLGRDWLGALPEPGPVLVVCCEDDADELWRRLDLIFQHYGAAYTDVKDLYALALAGQETLLAVPDRAGLIQTTKLFGRIREAACDIKPRLIVLDNAADIYGGNENDRAQVRQFIGILRGMAMAAGAGVLLTSHPSLTGINTGTGLSGSTAWNASVRSRLYFKRAITEKDEEPDPDLRVLEVVKSNYGPIGEAITLRWNKGLFLPVGGTSHLEKLAAEQAAEHLFLTLLDEFDRQGRNTSAKPTAPTYAPTLFAKEKQARERRIRKADFDAAMRSLFAGGKIRLQPYGAPSRETAKLVCCK